MAYQTRTDLWNPATVLGIYASDRGYQCSGTNTQEKQCGVWLDDNATGQLQRELYQIARISPQDFIGSPNVQNVARLALCDKRNYGSENPRFVGGHRVRQDQVNILVQRWSMIIRPTQAQYKPPQARYNPLQPEYYSQQYSPPQSEYSSLQSEYSSPKYKSSQPQYSPPHTFVYYNERPRKWYRRLFCCY